MIFKKAMETTQCVSIAFDFLTEDAVFYGGNALRLVGVFSIVILPQEHLLPLKGHCFYAFGTQPSACAARVRGSASLSCQGAGEHPE